MMYSNHFVMCVLVNGKPLKERADGIVTIPLGAEYTIRFKNKNSRRAMVNFTIDGENASGNGYVIGGHQDVEIKRFADRDQMFKFVHLESDEAQLDGKNGPNHDGSKGVIEAKFYLEKAYVPPPAPPTYIPVPYPSPYPVPVWPRPYYGQPTWHADCIRTRGMSTGGGVSGSCSAKGFESTASTETYSVSNAAPDVQLSLNSMAPAVAPATMMEGVTVGGQVTGQTFYTVNFDAETDHVTLRLVLRGTNEPVPVACAEETGYCGNCGTKKARKNDKFCGKCGTKL